MSSKPKISSAELQEAAGRIKVLHKKATEHALEIGRELLRIKAALPHGAFAKWVEKECEFKIRMAQNYMTLARAGASSAEIALVPSTLRVYLSNSTPPTVRQLVKQRLADGEQVSRHDLRAAIVEARKKRSTDANPAAPDLLTAGDTGTYPEIDRSRKVAELLMQRLSKNDYAYVMDGMTWGTWNRVLVWLRAKSTAAAEPAEAQPIANAVRTPAVPVAPDANPARRVSA
jgi:Protein of unknown function (DUF3102)